MSSKIETLLAGDAPSGIYKLSSRASIESVRHAAEKAGMHFAHVDGRAIDDKAGFITARGEALEFPGYSAKNWDAFEESLGDLSWLPANNGCVILFDKAGVFEAAQPKAFGTAFDILADASKAWGDAGTPMLILVRGAKTKFASL